MLFSFKPPIGRTRPRIDTSPVIAMVGTRKASLYGMQQAKMLGYQLPVIRVVGGGCKDQLLMDYTARATGRRVMAGPVEATAIGNICAQLIATGEVSDVWQARAIVADSFEIKDYTVADRAEWDDQYARFLNLLEQ